MSKQIELVEELFDELHELAVWEGCETGDLCHSLMDIWEGYSSYMSLDLQQSLENEIRLLYGILKEQKDEEDAEKELAKQIFGPATRISMKINDLTFEVTLKREVNNRDHKDMALALKEVVAMLEAEEVEDPDIF
jgi:hypothetical protein